MTSRTAARALRIRGTRRANTIDLVPATLTEANRTVYPTASRCYASAAPAAAASTPSPPPTTPSPPPQASSSKITAIVDQIGGLTLLEAAELVDALKARLNIADIALPAASAPSAPSAGSAAAAPEAEAPAAPKEKTAFKITLTKIDSAQKAKVIKEVKAVMPSMNLVEAKKFVESVPQVLKEAATKEEVEKLKKALTAVGAAVDVE